MTMRIIVDAFGGDYAPDEVIKGADLAAKEYGHSILLVGQEEVLKERLSALKINNDKIEILDAPGIITMEDEPRSILKAHKDSSMAIGLNALANGEGDAFVSAGSTGALLMGATFIVKRIKGVSRPALGTVLPSQKDPFLLLDMGANVDCRPEMLLQFAHMGSLYMTHVMKKGEVASVGLLNVGTEDTKGGELQHETFKLLKESNLNFVGNVEARDVLPGEAADVIVTDGFSGNVLLKGMEGAVSTVMHSVKQVFLSNLMTKIGALLVKSHVADLKKQFSTSEYGGAVLLGVQKPVIKAHGNSNANAFKNAIRVAADAASSDLSNRIATAIQQSKITEEDSNA